MTGLITTLVGTLMVAGALSTTAVGWHSAADPGTPPQARPASASTAASGGDAQVSVSVPVVAFSKPEVLPDGRVRVAALLTDPGVTATVEVAAPNGSRHCRASLDQGVPVVLDCAVGRSRSLRLSYVLSDGRSSVIKPVVR